MSRKPLWAVAASVAALATAVVGGLPAALAAGGGDAPAAAGGDAVVIALAGPLSGPYASMGDQQRRGVEQAVADLNAAGGLLGRPLKVIAADDACEPKQAVAVANQLARDRVSLVVGHFCSSSSIPAAAVYAEEGILQITPASTNPELTNHGYRTVFRVCGRDDQQGAIAGAFLARRYAGRKVAIIHDKSTYGTGLAEATRVAMVAAGLSPVLNETFIGGEKDYSALVTKLKAADVDAIYIGGYYTEAGLIARQMRDQGLKAQIVAGEGLISNEYWAITGAAGEGTLMTFNPDPRTRAEAAPLVDSFRQAGFEPEGYTLYAYAAVQVFAEAVRQAGSSEGAAVAAALRRHSFSTVIGPLAFDAKGDVTTPAYIWYRWHDGRYSPDSAE